LSSRLKSSIKFIVFLAVGVLLMYFAFRKIDLGRMLTDLKEANYSWVGVSLALSVIALASRSYRWGMLIEPLHKRPKFSNLFHAVNVGYFANLAFPRLGEITRCTALYEVEETSIDSLVGTVIAERVIDVICLLILIVLTVLTNVKLIGGFFLNMFKDKLEFITHMSPVVSAILILIVAAGIFFIYLFRSRIMALPLAGKVMKFMTGIIAGLKSVSKLKNRKAFIFHTVVIWLCYYLSSYVAFFSIPETSHLGLSAGLFILVVGSIGMSAPVQGGFGAFHFMVASGLVLYGIVPHIDPVTGKEISKGLLFATIVHSSQTLLILVFGCISLIMLNIEKRKQLKHAKA